MPGINSTSPRYEGWDMEYDHYQHYFYDDHDPDEDFFKSTAPSEDIWKKFELVPTPPMSPIRTLEGAARVGLVYPSLGDKLEWVSQFLGQDDEQDFPCKLSPAEETLGNLSSIIIQDCMWSGFSAGQQLEKVVADRIASCPPAPGPTKLALQTTGAGGGVSAGKSQCVPAADVPALNGAPADCVDPTAVLTFPLSGCYKKQVSSGSESHTDSSDDDDDDDDEDDDDEEEIDVVTVDQQRRKRPRGRRLGGVARRRRQPVTITVRADPLDPCAKRFHISIHQQQHNYAAPSPDAMATPPPATPTAAAEPPRKRARHDGGTDGVARPDSHPAAALPRLGHAPQDFGGGRPESPGSGSDDDDSSSSSSASSSPAGSPRASSPGPAHHHPLKPRPHPPLPPPTHSHPGSPQSSDGEDTDRRRTHNFLERKRRNDLRSRFLALRDEIPGLAECPKTPKVAILTQATEYLRQLHAGERQRAQERRQLRARQQQLLRRLAQLKRS